MTDRPPDFSIHELHLPESLDGPDAMEFGELSSVMDAMVLETWGNLDRASSAQARLAGWRDTPYEASRNFFARVDGSVVGHASCQVPLKDNVQTAWLQADVLAGHRRQGIGTALLRTVEGVAVAQGRHVLQAHTEHPIGSAATGAGEVPRGVPDDSPGVAFCLKNGYTLEQASRFSSLDMDHNGEWQRLELTAHSKADAAYEVRAWTNRCPGEYVDHMAVLMGRMSTDTPAGGLEIEAESWDAARVRQLEDTTLAEGQTALVAAAQHRRTGELVAYTVIYLDSAKPWVAEQDDTLVAEPHRGHGLGMLVKLANLRRVQTEYPAVQRVMTFNAEENEHMLSINVQLGFKPAGYDGEWQKRIK
ncbi:GNAT family N-acetyltransferase [Arthrobacter sp. FW306-2-2C-D06B]|uniref:GNAT family N-acetyltransferase n=1 Tax=Arthrobacter sp. FW306-2-2C-D06B TaxID=2879618 RepID=UPI001F284F10|nr:GNAT family N-acetyltransferase [Arthrobacter sp. FW306-2-2C-D06B]UKA57831.1 GNAT family N-acetyltransferase [Arthrobacter sp. FW306-2-2C-D06B]